MPPPTKDDVPPRYDKFAGRFLRGVNSIPQANFKIMGESSAEDWQLIMGEQLKFVAGLPERILAHMRLLDDDYERTEAFVEKYDNRAFDADKPKLSLDTFAPLVRSVFSDPKNSMYRQAIA